MKILKERKPVLIKILAVAFLILVCFNLPSLLFWPLCLKQDLVRPPNTEVLVSACKRPFATGVPGGEVLFVREKFTDKIYLLDLRTGEKRKVPNDTVDGHSAFGVNYVNVGYYRGHTDKLNSFQLILIDRSDNTPVDFASGHQPII